MLVYIYQADLLCEECGEKVREELAAKDEAPADPDDESSYDSDDFPKGPTEEGESDSPSHCAGCGCFLESPLTDEGVDDLLTRTEDALCGRRDVGDVLTTWINYYEGSGDDRVSLATLAESGLTIGEILSALDAKHKQVRELQAEIARLEQRAAGHAKE